MCLTKIHLVRSDPDQNYIFTVLAWETEGYSNSVLSLLDSFLGCCDSVTQKWFSVVIKKPLELINGENKYLAAVVSLKRK